MLQQAPEESDDVSYGRCARSQSASPQFPKLIRISGDPDPPLRSCAAANCWEFKEEVAEKENSEDQSVLLAADRQFSVHRQRRKPNVDAIEKGNDEKQETKGRILILTF